MTKRNLEILTYVDLENIKNWLGLHSQHQIFRCPFHIVRRPVYFSTQSIEEASKKCKSIFPNLPTSKQNPKLFVCPCTKYPLHYVKRVARQIFKEKGRNYETF